MRGRSCRAWYAFRQANQPELSIAFSASRLPAAYKPAIFSGIVECPLRKMVLFEDQNAIIQATQRSSDTWLPATFDRHHPRLNIQLLSYLVVQVRVDDGVDDVLRALPPVHGAVVCKRGRGCQKNSNPSPTPKRKLCQRTAPLSSSRQSVDSKDLHNRGLGAFLILVLPVRVILASR